ncbi:fungal zn(2)-Cys(6) binuclear cluster domain-containing protein [Hirsutella rhossiliensis]|uniref:Fungal zn(2)-Cys(6) binuclear cluster domain-containing protein n=1 Tax=Hirsutella rhossiliensis TaxID=111463 RepID=A0A9P8SF04_9HYPO|nr:fungal zn(2)-Cys(6) binuclear cluster domain-containing protein [Hirsutella rhossiliensis]KAH0958925.1 fungal zn(2)-Cys(6) binuclear cluster domain-containing protein [Hirsutella rhossiliensis]
MGGKITRACDACRVRKVRCSGDQPCAQCAHLNLTCAFAPAPAKRKPAVRGRLVAQLRNKGTSKIRGALDPDPSPAAAVTSIAGIVDATHSASPQPESIGCSGYSRDFFLGLLPDFEQLVYPVNPVLTPDEIRAAIATMHSNFEDAALVHAFGAVTINLTQTSWTLHGDVAAQMTSLVHYSLWAHRKAELARESDASGLQSELPITVKRIMTCIFNEISLMAFKRFDRSFAALREAIAMIQMLNVHQYTDGDTLLGPKEVSRRQRMYWEAYIHERFLCIVSGFPCIMVPLRTGLPITDSSVPSWVTLGFNRLIHLFGIMDGPLLTHWAAQHDPTELAPAVTARWIEIKQAELDQDEARAAEAAGDMTTGGHGALSELQHVDLFVTRLWLRTLVWQLALSHRLLRSAPPQNSHEGLSLHFPAQRLSAQLRSLVGRLGSISSVVNHGSGLLQKLFEITSTVADVLALPRATSQAPEEARARIEDFFFLVRFLFSFERTQKHQRDYLREKLEALQHVYGAIDFGDIASASPNT